MRTVIWSHIGTCDPRGFRVGQVVTAHITVTWPPAFMSVGSGDLLAPQSMAPAEALCAQGVEVDALFFPYDHDPPLEHEHQLLLSTDAGRLALDRSVAFLPAHAN